MDFQEIALETYERAKKKCLALLQAFLKKILKYKKVRTAFEFALEKWALAKRKYVKLQFKRRNWREKKLLRYIVKQLAAYFLVMYLFFFLIFFVN